MPWSGASPDFADAVTVERLQFNTYTHHSLLQPGQYFWRYRFETKQGKVSNWSIARSFTVTSNAVEFPMPTRAQQRERVPQEHPRLLMRPEDLPRLRAAARASGGGAAAEFARLRAAAGKLLKAQPTPEPTVRGFRAMIRCALWWQTGCKPREACQEAETGVRLLDDRRAKVWRGGRKWILHLASWDPDGPTNFKLNCEAANRCCGGCPRAYTGPTTR
jgi:hypothetical protein